MKKLTSGLEGKTVVAALVVLSMCGEMSVQNSGSESAPVAKTSTTQKTGNSPELQPHAIDKKEEKAYEKFKAVPATDAANKVQAGESFLKAYPKSQLAQYVYPFIVVGYIQLGQTEKGLAAGQEDLAVNPTDYRTMAVLSQALARTYNPSAPNAADQLAKADDYGKKALEGVATWKKPEGMTDVAFAQTKSDTEGMAHAGVGLVLLRQDKFEEAIPELEKATSLNATDQANFYLLGMAQANTKRYGEAATAFAKCAALSGSLQATCTDAAADAKKSAGQ